MHPVGEQGRWKYYSECIEERSIYQTQYSGGNQFFGKTHEGYIEIFHTDIFVGKEKFRKTAGTIIVLV